MKFSALVISISLILIGLLTPLGRSVFAATSILAERYNHDFHDAKVFKPLGFECAKCHNFALDKVTKQLTPTNDLKKSMFRIPLKEVCHQCHRSTDPRFVDAPKTCYTCHYNPAGLSAIMPPSHSNVVWKSTHGAEARIGGDSCLNCHVTSQCVKCHSERNDIELRNHPRNFRFYHSVQARLQPQRCDTCHTKSFCTNCHLGIK